MLGTRLSKSLSAKNHSVFLHGRSINADVQIDLKNEIVFSDFLINRKIDTVINLIALSDIDKCEADIKEAYISNVSTVQCLVNAISLITFPERPHLIHISSDAIYNGSGYQKEDFCAPCNIYGITKYFSELVASKINATILRTNFFGKSHTTNRISLSDWIVSSIKNNQAINVYDNIFFTPLHFKSLADAINIVVMNPTPGTFNLGSRNGCSKAEFAFLVLKELNLVSSLLTSGPYIYKNTARSYNMRMDSTLFEKTFSFKLPTIESEIKLIAGEYEDD